MNIFKTSKNLDIFSKSGLEKLNGYVEYKTASPFPHLILDGIFNSVYLRKILSEWPPLDANLELHDDGTYVKKKFGTTWKTEFGPYTKRFFQELASPNFLQILEKITGISALIADPYQFGGGLHTTLSGGKLAIHADYNKHPTLRLDRRLNLLIYLNDEWKEENGGALELWDASMTECIKKVFPMMNRMVIFSTTSTSYHGQPEIIKGPKNLKRKSIALYYFSNGRPEEENSSGDNDEHSTLWKVRKDMGY